MNLDLQMTLFPQSLATNITDKQVMSATLIYTWDYQVIFVKLVPPVVVGGRCLASLRACYWQAGMMGRWSSVHVFIRNGFVVHVPSSWSSSAVVLLTCPAFFDPLGLCASNMCLLEILVCMREAITSVGYFHYWYCE